MHTRKALARLLRGGVSLFNGGRTGIATAPTGIAERKYQMHGIE